MSKTDYSYKKILAEGFFCLCILAVFLPIKIYPLIFLTGCLFFYLDTAQLSRHYWTIFLLIFTAYASFIFLVHLPADRTEITNFIKLPINFIFLYFAVSWLNLRDNNRLLRWLDTILHIVFMFTLVQLLLYHEAFHFSLLSGSPSSAKASALYQSAPYFWGLNDKNMFGARIALLGFVYILLPLVRSNQISWWRIGLIFLLAWLSLSRTPVVALLLGIFCLLWAVSNFRIRIILAVLCAAALPFIAQKVIRIENLTASNDGMGVRLVYWKSFFEHFFTISPLGNGFMSGKAFLSQYADFYHGEPHIHNTFLNCYLDFGIIGFLSYLLFLLFFYRYCSEKQPGTTWWLLVFLPLIAIMMILYSGYDNDIILYLSLIFLLGSTRKIDFKQLKPSIGR